MTDWEDRLTMLRWRFVMRDFCFDVLVSLIIIH